VAALRGAGWSVEVGQGGQCAAAEGGADGENIGGRGRVHGGGGEGGEQGAGDPGDVVGEGVQPERTRKSLGGDQGRELAAQGPGEGGSAAAARGEHGQDARCGDVAGAAGRRGKRGGEPSCAGGQDPPWLPDAVGE